jgi:hypothetical protein
MEAMKRGRSLFGEARPLFVGKTILSNLGHWGSDTFDTFVKQPLKQKNYVGATMGAVSAGIGLLLEAPDQVYAGIVDKELRQEGGSRFARDVKHFGHDLSQGHLISAGLDVLRTPGSLVMDGLQLATRGHLRQTINP